MIWPVDPHRFLAFAGVMALLAATPGPANLFAVATGVRGGPGAVARGVVGMNLATLVWFIGAALGLGAVVVALPELFRWIAILGGLYVAWLGLKSLFGRPQAPADPELPKTARGRGPLVDGFMVQIANPKAVLFFTAVLPPFMEPARPLPAQLLLFAVATIGLDCLTMTTYGLGGAALAARMRQPRFARVFGIVTGLLLLAAAALILFRQ